MSFWQFVILVHVVSVAVVVQCLQGPPTEVTREKLLDWMCEDPASCLKSDHAARPREIFLKVLSRVKKMIVESVKDEDGYLRQQLQENPALWSVFANTLSEKALRGASDKEILNALEATLLSGNTTYPYFDFLPMPMASFKVGGPAVTYSSPCYSSVEGVASFVNASSVNLTLNYSGQKSFLCTDAMMFWGGSVVKFVEFNKLQGSKTYLFEASTFSNETAWYLRTIGIRALRFPHPYLLLVGPVIATYKLLQAGDYDPPMPPDILSANLHFVRDYVEFSPRMQPKSPDRTPNASVAPLIEHTIQSGDAIAVTTLNGLDPPLSWADGTTASHTAVAMRMPDTNELYIFETTPSSLGPGDWPTDGVQRTPFAQWVKQATKLEMNTLLVPLAPKYRAKLNVSAAIAWWRQREGLTFGAQTELWGWIDTPNGNFPCLPPNFETCLTETLMEVVMTLLDRVEGNSITNQIRQAMNHRAGTWPMNLSIAELQKYVYTTKNMTLGQLYSLPELDSWNYYTKRYGHDTIAPAPVCSALVCSMLKAGGVFSEINGEINCNEQGPWDLFSFKLWDTDRMGEGRPSTCRAADPDNELCQLSGPLKFYLRPDVNTRSPYPHMGDACSDKTPHYLREPGC